jgi:hypothetical protein
LKLNELNQDQQTHIVYFAGRVTQNGFRDLFYYIDVPKIEQPGVNEFCNSIMKERGINFGMEKDPKWKAVSGFIK